MPWIPSDFVPPKGRRGGEQPKARRIRCDQCSWETKNWYWGVKHSRQEAGVWWRAGFLPGTSERAAWCSRCASATFGAARQSYEDTRLDVEFVMSAFWMDPTTAGCRVVPLYQGPPKAPLPSASSQAHRGRVPPKTEKRLAAFEKTVAKLQLQVAELQKHPSDAAIG